MGNIAGVRFKKAGRIYHFDAGELELQPGDNVVVQTVRGLELGQVVQFPVTRPEIGNEEELSPVVRKATEEDILQDAGLEKKTEEALLECGKMINELNLPMKLLTAEYTLDNSRLTFLFSAEERVDFRELVRKLTAKFKMRVELRQVGSRDEAKLLGSYGRCGRDLCCASFLAEFAPVSIKMAKDQDLPLNPMKISGACGRLMCCLAYENEQYKALKAKMPRTGARVATKMGEGTVVGHDMLREQVFINVGETTVEIPLAEVKVLDQA